MINETYKAMLGGKSIIRELSEYATKRGEKIGYDFVLNEEATNVSQGQRQLLTIARSILANNPILILDEATSALDIDTEERVLKNIMKKEKGRTCVVTTHRPSVLSVSDHIYEIRERHLKKLK